MKKYILLLISVFLIGYLVVVFRTKQIQLSESTTHNQIVFIKIYISLQVVNKLRLNF